MQSLSIRACKESKVKKGVILIRLRVIHIAIRKMSRVGVFPHSYGTKFLVIVYLKTTRTQILQKRNYQSLNHLNPYLAGF